MIEINGVDLKQWIASRRNGHGDGDDGGDGGNGTGERWCVYACVCVSLGVSDW